MALQECRYGRLSPEYVSILQLKPIKSRKYNCRYHQWREDNLNYCDLARTLDDMSDTEYDEWRMTVHDNLLRNSQASDTDDERGDMELRVYVSACENVESGGPDTDDRESDYQTALEEQATSLSITMLL
jgi:hypothetical protein